MKKLSLMFLVLLPMTSMGFTLDWKGTHRVEFIEVDKPTLEAGARKSYLLNHLTLSPHIIAADGVNIVASFEILNNKNGYKNSKLGEVWGPGIGTTTPSSRTDSNTLSNQQPTSDLQVSELYMSINQEFGSLLLGRAPVHFGLGITHNAGMGPYDHWIETRDIVGYKFYVGNLFIMPSISKVKDGELRQGDDITDQTLHFEYSNPDTGNLLGLFYETRKSTIGSNDTPLAPLGASSKTTHFNTTSYNIIFGKTFESFDFKVEGAFKSGSTGLANSSGAEVHLNGFAVVSEFNLNRDESTVWNIKFGTASGDNPSTESFEGYMLNRNYDIAMLMFNHPMGKLDIFKTKLDRGTSSAGTSADDESISNALFIAPSLKKKLSDKWVFSNTIAWAQLNNSNVNTGSSIEDVKSDIGFEWDLAFSYKPHNNIEWKNGVGFFFPGASFKGASLGLKNSNVIGMTSAAAISF
jgi:hypothetical protein